MARKRRKSVELLVPEEDSLLDVVRSLRPLADQFLQTKIKEIELQAEASRQANDHKAAILQHNASSGTAYFSFVRRRFYLLYAAICFVIISLLGIACGLIFLKDQPREGLLIISHVMAIAGGLLAGIGLMRRANKLQQ